MNFSAQDISFMDQCLAVVSEKLDMLVVSYGASTGCLPSTGPEVSVPFMSQALKQITSHESCVELAAMAIHRLWVAREESGEGLG